MSTESTPTWPINTESPEARALARQDSAPSSPLRPTPGQTVGPFFGYALPVEGGAHIVPEGATDTITLHGYVMDGAGSPIPDALIEIWQAAPDGTPAQREGSLRRGEEFTGFGRAETSPDGHYRITTVLPGPMNGGPAFFAVAVFARGLLDRLFTRAYVPGTAPDGDTLLRSLAPERALTLIARLESEGVVRHDICLQGDDARETVFLNFTGDVEEATDG